jgi:AraC-like DNA-binding protein
VEPAPAPDAVRTTLLRPGLWVTQRSLDTGPARTTRFALERAPVYFGYLLSGRNICVYDEAPADEDGVNEAGSNGIRFLPGTSGRIEHDGTRRMLSVSVAASRDTLLDYLAENLRQIPRAFRDVLEGCGGTGPGACGDAGRFLWRGRNTAAKRELAWRMLRCPYTGLLRSLFLESQALAFILQQLDECFRNERVELAGPRLDRADVARIRQARELLLDDLESPPSIEELARMVGVNSNKLKCGFREVFGTSVFGHYREFRLERAREMLESGQCNVTEAALNIGYSSISHFCRAFQQRFGTTPKQYVSGRAARRA